MLQHRVFLQNLKFILLRSLSSTIKLVLLTFLHKHRNARKVNFTTRFLFSIFDVVFILDACSAIQ